MRSDNANFKVLNDLPSRELRYYVRISFDTAMTENKFFTSHSDIDLTSITASANIFADALGKNITSTSQTINPRKATTQIGNFNFSLIDRDGTIQTEIKNQLDNLRGLRLKTVKVYAGYKDLAVTDFVEISTQIIKEVTEKNGKLNFRCSDIQRQLKTQIFQPNTTNIAATVGLNDTKVYVTSHTKFEGCTHTSSFSDGWNAGLPNQEYFYFKIGEEIIRCTSKNNDGTPYFVVEKRGALGTLPAEHVYDGSSSSVNQPLVTEVIYLELPAPKLAYAIMTGSIYGTAHTIPSNWQLNIDTAYINTSSFVNIGKDLWDTTTDDNGLILRFVDEQKIDGKKFVEEQIFLPCGITPIISNDGQYGVKRMSTLLHDAPYQVLLDEKNIISHSELTHNMNEVINVIKLYWDYNFHKKDYDRLNVLSDSASQATHQKNVDYTIKCRGLHNSRHSPKTVRNLFNSVRDRYAGPPQLLSVTTTFENNVIQVGDLVRVQLSSINDFLTDTTLNRTFEVQSTNIDWIKGTITLKLFGSSQAASIDALPSAMNDSYFSNSGTNIATYLSASEFEVISDIGHIKANCSLVGNANLNSGIYYYAGDLTIDAGVSLSIDKNVYLKVLGTLTINGKIDGKGASGATGAQFFGTTKSGGGINYNFLEFTSDDGVVNQGQVSSVPVFDIKTSDGTDLVGIPDNLVGTSGATGGNAEIWVGGSYFSTAASGGAGGGGGAGLAVLCKGIVFGISAEVDLSGNDGTIGSAYETSSGFFICSGAGAGGAPGAFLIMIDGDLLSAPTNVTDYFIANLGNSPAQTYRMQKIVSQFRDTNQSGNHDSFFAGYNSESQKNSAFRIKFIDAVENVDTDISRTAVPQNPLTLSFNENLNSPHSLQGNLVSVDITANAPNDNNYWYSNIYYRVSGSDKWDLVGAANTEVSFSCIGDGQTYEFLAKSVNKYGIENIEGVVDSFTISNVTLQSVVEEPEYEVQNVTGLEIIDQGNDTIFTGKECKITWRATSKLNYDITGSDSGSGIDNGRPDLSFKDYLVEIYDGATLVRSYFTTDNWFNFDAEKNLETFGSMKRSFTFKVYQRTTFGISLVPAVLTVSNTAPVVPTISLLSNYKSIDVETSTQTTDRDVAGFVVYISTDDVNFYYAGQSKSNFVTATHVNVIPISPGSTYYVRSAFFDEFFDGTDGQGTFPNLLDGATTSVLNFSTSQSIATSKLEPEYFDSGTLETTMNLGASQLQIQAANRLIVVADEQATPVQRIALGKLGSSTLSQYGLQIKDDLGNVVFYSGDQTYIEGAYIQNLTAGSILSGSFAGETYTGGIFKSADSLHAIDFDNKKMYLETGGTFGNAGFQVDYSGSARLYVGDGQDNFLQFDGTDVSIGKDTELGSADAYHNQAIYYHSFMGDYDGFFKTGAVALESILSDTRVNLTLGSALVFSKANYTSFAPMDWGKKRSFKVAMQMSGISASSQEVTYVCGEHGYNYFGFLFKGANLYGISAQYGSGTGITSILSSSMSMSQVYKIEAIFNPGTDVKFYLDDVLKGSLNTASLLPSGTQSKTVMFHVKAPTSSLGYHRIGEVAFLQEK